MQTSAQGLESGDGVGRRPHILRPDESMTVVALTPGLHAGLVASEHQRTGEVGPQHVVVGPAASIAMAPQHGQLVGYRLRCARAASRGRGADVAGVGVLGHQPQR